MTSNYMKTTPPSPTRPEAPLPAMYIAKKFMLSRTTLWRWRKLGLPVQQVGAKQFIYESDVVAFISKMNAAAPFRQPTASRATTLTSTSAQSSPSIPSYI